MPTLHIEHPQERECRFAWRDGSIGLGRHSSNDVVLSADGISRWHAALFADESGGFRLRDLGSRRGVRIDGHRAWTHLLASGDTFTLGEFRLTFEPTPESGDADARVVFLGSDESATEEAPTPLPREISSSAIPLDGTAPPGPQTASVRRLLEALRELGGKLDVDEFLRCMVDQVLATSPTEAFAALVGLDGTLDVRRRVSESARSREAPVQVSRTLVSECILSGRSLVVANLSGVAGFSTDSVHDLGIRAAVCVPLLGDGRVRGLLYADWRHGRAPGEAELEWIAALAAYATEVFENGLRHRALRIERDRLARSQGLSTDLVGVSRAARELRDLADRCAAVEVDVLLTGETGTGKELVARRIHERSRRRAAPFVAVNCAAIPTELFEAELFGHARGAFTGAVTSRAGRFREATGGTLFLDEVAELPLAHQAKLLRVLEERKVTPVGGAPFDVDVRIVAATNLDLARCVQEGRVRADLVQRLGAPVATPPLRDRREDLPMLAYFLLDVQAAVQGKMVRSIAPAVMERFTQYDWPGNVRELRSCLRNALLFCEGELCPQDLRLNPEIAGSEAVPLPSLDAVEREHIGRVLAATGGNQAQAAKVLGVSENTLRAKMARYGFRREEYRR